MLEEEGLPCSAGRGSNRPNRASYLLDSPIYAGIVVISFTGQE